MIVSCTKCGTTYRGEFAAIIANGWTHILIGPDEYWFCASHPDPRAQAPKRPTRTLA